MVMPSGSSTDRPDLPESMTWEELDQLPEEIAAQIELWEGRVVWVRRRPGAGAGIPSYWEVDLKKDLTGIGALRVYVLEIGHAELPPGVRPLRNANYLLAGEWTPNSAADVSFPYPLLDRDPLVGAGILTTPH
ncbi:hypothetical protein [Nocardia sp. CA-290969]|uniref:hypothetical protein n=1 Tax=Nocardia sp. CA-290969 TaxID=3239986 RepID=UPI003D8C598E